MKALQKIIILLILALQMAELEYVVFHLWGWLGLFGVSILGTIIWLIGASLMSDDV